MQVAQNVPTTVLKLKKFGSFSFSPTSLKHEFYGLTSGFTRLIIETRYVYHGLISLHANFHDNRTKWTVTSNIKICSGGGGGGGEEKEPKIQKKT